MPKIQRVLWQALHFESLCLQNGCVYTQNCPWLGHKSPAGICVQVALPSIPQEPPCLVPAGHCPNVSRCSGHHEIREVSNLLMASLSIHSAPEQISACFGGLDTSWNKHSAFPKGSTFYFVQGNCCDPRAKPDERCPAKHLPLLISKEHDLVQAFLLCVSLDVRFNPTAIHTLSVFVLFFF